jgi:hypothetical protein
MKKLFGFSLVALLSAKVLAAVTLSWSAPTLYDDGVTAFDTADLLYYEVQTDCVDGIVDIITTTATSYDFSSATECAARIRAVDVDGAVSEWSDVYQTAGYTGELIVADYADVTDSVEEPVDEDPVVEEPTVTVPFRAPKRGGAR